MRPFDLSGRKVDKNDHRIYVQYIDGEQISPKEPTYNLSEDDAAEQDPTHEEEHLEEETHRRDSRVRQAASSSPTETR